MNSNNIHVATTLSARVRVASEAREAVAGIAKADLQARFPFMNVERAEDTAEHVHFTLTCKPAPALPLDMRLTE